MGHGGKLFKSLQKNRTKREVGRIKSTSRYVPSKMTMTFGLFHNKKKVLQSSATFSFSWFSVRSNCTNCDVYVQVTTGVLNDDVCFYAEPDCVSEIWSVSVLWLKRWGDTAQLVPPLLTFPQTKILRNVCKFLGWGFVGGREKIYNKFLEIPNDT
jgi:hypothetical protein